MAAARRSPPMNLNLRVRGMRPSATIAIAERCRGLRAAGKKVFRLGLGQSPFPVPECVVASLRESAHEKDYLPVRGLPALREAIARHYRTVYGVRCSAGQVMIGPGSKELMFLLQLVFYGEIVVATPCWVSYEPQARVLGRRVRRVPTMRESKWKLLPAQLEAVCREDPGRPRLLILNYPANPGGGTYGPGELDALAAVARRHRVILLSDEIYGKLNFYGNHGSLAPHYPEGTIISGGLSKWCGAGGWRLGFFIAPKGMRWLLDAMAAVASETFTATSAPIQHAAVRAFAGGPEIDDYLLQCRRLLRGLGNLLAARLEQAGALVSPPLGGFYLFPEFTPLAERLKRRGIATSAELCERLLEESGVALLPGSDFGRDPAELTARLAYVDFDGKAMLAAARGLPEDQPIPESFFARHAAPTIEGVRRLCAWVRK